MPLEYEPDSLYNQEDQQGHKSCVPGRDPAKHPRQEKGDFLVEHLKENCNQVKSNVKWRACFSKWLESAFICSCFFQIQSTRPYFVRRKKNNNTKTSSNSNIQQYTYIFCHIKGPGPAAAVPSVAGCHTRRVGRRSQAMPAAATAETRAPLLNKRARCLPYPKGRQPGGPEAALLRSKIRNQLAQLVPVSSSSRRSAHARLISARALLLLLLLRSTAAAEARALARARACALLLLLLIKRSSCYARKLLQF